MFCWTNEQEDPVAGMALDERQLASCTMDLIGETWRSGHACLREKNAQT